MVIIGSVFNGRPSLCTFIYNRGSMHIFILSNLILHLIILYINVVVFTALLRVTGPLSIFAEFVCIVKILHLCVNCYPSIVVPNYSNILTTKLFPSQCWLDIPYFASNITNLLPLTRILELSHYQDRSVWTCLLKNWVFLLRMNSIHKLRTLWQRYMLLSLSWKELKYIINVF